MDRFTITVDDKELLAYLGQAEARADNMSPVMGDISLVLADGIEQAFADQAAPDGTPWEKLRDSTIAARKRKGYWPGKIGQQTGRLASSIVPDHGPTFAAAGTNVEYARTFFFGAERGEFGSTKHGVPIPWGDIPGRQGLGLSQDGTDEIVSLLAAYVAGR